MMKNKSKNRIVAAMICAAFIAAAICSCGKNGDEPSELTASAASGEAVQASADTDEMNLSYTDRDLSGDYDEATATKITLSGSSASVSGSGAAVSGSTLTVSADGTYIISGTLNGRIVISAGDSDKVQLVLDGASVTCSDNAPIYVESADKVFITLADGSENSLTDGNSYSNTGDNASIDGAVFSRADLTINGGGSLNITANFANGIVSKDDLVITGGSISVAAAADGMQGKDCVKICGGSITIDAADDGIKSNNDEDANRGFVSIDGGMISVNSGNDGVQAETLLRMTDGTADIVTSSGAGNPAKNSTAPDRGMGIFGGQSSSSSASAESAKGLKAGSLVQLTGGTVTIDSTDDAVHSNGDVQIDGGSFTLASGDDGLHADAALIINGGNVDITQSYEGIEGNNITVTGGTISLVSSDDGFNAAGGDSASAMGGAPFGGSSSNHSLTFTGGYTHVNAAGDGLDSNGSLAISGGVILVSGSTDSGNGALDYDSTATITGGTVIAAGSTGMAQNFSNDSSQCSVLYGFTSSVSGGQSVAITDSDGNVLASFTPENTYQCVVISAPGMSTDSSYTIITGGTVSGADKFGYASSGTVNGGTSAVFTQSSVIISAGSSTGTMGGGFGGGTMGGGAMGGGFGGKRGM